jgi:hypothetical protein
VFSTPDGSACTALSEATVSPPTVSAGGRLTVSGGPCFVPDHPVTAALYSDPVPLGSGRTDASGRYILSVRIPADTAPGQHRIAVSGPGLAGGTHSSAAAIIVTHDGASSDPDSDNRSGAALLLAALGVLLVAGAALTYLRARRQTEVVNDP